MFRLIKALTVTILLTATLQAQVYRIEVEENCTTGFCPIPTTRKAIASCVAIGSRDGHYFFLTTSHTGKDNFKIRINNHLYRARKYDTFPTLSWEQVTMIVTTEPLPENSVKRINSLGKESVQPGTPCTMIGFENGQYKEQRTHVTAVGQHFLETTDHLNKGASGGALLSDNGDLLGIIIGYDPRNNRGGYHKGSSIRSFMIQAKYIIEASKKPVEAPKPEERPNLPTNPSEDVTGQSEAPEKVSEPPTPPKQEIPDVKVPIIIPEIPKITPPKPPETAIPATPPVIIYPQPAPSTDNTGTTFIGSLRNSFLGLPWLDIASVAIMAATGSGGVWGGLKLAKGIYGLVRGSSPKQDFQCPQANNPPVPRDQTELRQIVGLRQQEQREPLQDAFYGIAFEDEFRSNPEQSLRDAWNNATQRFNNVAPLSATHTTLTEHYSQKGMNDATGS